MSSAQPAPSMRRRRPILGLAALAILILAPVVWSIWNPDAVRFDAQDVIAAVQGQPVWGPIILVTVMATAVVVSPLPSAPITIGAGAVYGHYWGTLYAIVGAQLGAMIAFELTRRLGRDWAVRRFGALSVPRAANTQAGLFLIVFASRLLPAVSFDVVSYAAGLTRLKRKWFALATAAGMVPATFLLSHAGAGLRGSPDGLQQLLAGLAGLGLLVLAGMAVGLWRNRRGAVPRSDERNSEQ